MVEHARALAILCPDMPAEAVAEQARSGSDSPYVAEWVGLPDVVRMARSEEPPRVPRPAGLLGSLLCGLWWRRPAGTCGREGSWLLPWELRDVWPRIFAELVPREQPSHSRARAEGVVKVWGGGHEVTVGNLARVLRSNRDLRALMAAVDAPSDLWQALAQEMGLPTAAARRRAAGGSCWVAA